MPSSSPPAYTSLREFRDLFRIGVPVLMYHKLGPRPRRVKRRGLYVSERLFDRQLDELRREGFVPASLGAWRPSGSGGGPSVAITFDDGFSSVLEHGLAPLERHGFRAVQFLVADLLGKSNVWDHPDGEVPEPLMDPSQVRAWLAAGHAIGSHSLTHPRLTQLSPDRAREEIAASKRKLEDLFGVAVEHFCYPYGDWNPAVRDWAEEAGYRTACTTDFGVNTAETPPLALKRITARYRSRSLASLVGWMRGARAS